MVLIIIYIHRLVKENFKTSFIICVTLVLAGASGNIVDSVFYGVIFDASYPGHIASLVPWGAAIQRYYTVKVVDMLYFPLISGSYLTGSLFWEVRSFCSFASSLIWLTQPSPWV